MIDDLLRRQFGVTQAELLGTLEVATRAGVLILGVCYLLGLLIVNAYLLQFGVYSSGLLRVDYVMAGALWLFWVLVGYGALSFGFRSRAEDASKPASGNKLARAVQVAAGAGYLVLGPFFFAAGLTGRAFEFDDWQMWMLCGVVLYTALTVRLLIRAVAATALGALLKMPTGRLSVPSSLVVQVMMLLSSILLYSRAVHPLCLPMFGGGKPTPVTLTFAAGADVASSVFDQKSRSYELVSEGGEWLVLAPMESQQRNPFRVRQAIRVRRDIVASITSDGDGTGSLAVKP